LKGRTVSHATIQICGEDFEVEYDFKITHSGSPESYSSYGGDPAEPAEFEIELLALQRPKQPDAAPGLEMPKWLKDLIEQHLSERDDINEIVQQADMERDPFDDGDYR
jgi:hypothetical protein